MDVRAAASGTPIPDIPRLAGPSAASAVPAATSAPPEDGAAGLVHLLATPEIHGLLHSIESRHFSTDSAALDHLLQTAGAAVARHDTGGALKALSEYVHRNPEHVGGLLNSPALAPIQGEVRELLHRVTLDARVGAEHMVAGASRLVSMAVQHPPQLDGPAVVTVAERLLETGQLANYVRASELSQTVFAYYSEPPMIERPDPAKGRRTLAFRTAELVVRMWQRAPLLVLLFAWLGLGILVGLASLGTGTPDGAVEIWAVGFLFLVVLQFIVSVRGGVFRKRS